MPPQHKQLKIITLTIGGTSYEGQVSSWTLDPAEQDGDRQFTFSPDGEFTEDADPEPVLKLTVFADWRSDGISDYLWAHRGEVAAFVLDHHPDDPLSHVRWSGSVLLKAPPAGGDARATETAEIELPCQGMPVYTRV